MVPFIVFDQLLSFTLEPVVQKLDLFKFKILIKLENVKIEILSIFGADWLFKGVSLDSMVQYFLASLDLDLQNSEKSEWMIEKHAKISVKSGLGLGFLWSKEANSMLGKVKFNSAL